MVLLSRSYQQPIILNPKILLTLPLIALRCTFAAASRLHACLCYDSYIKPKWKCEALCQARYVNINGGFTATSSSPLPSTSNKDRLRKTSAVENECRKQNISLSANVGKFDLQLVFITRSVLRYFVQF